MRRFLLLALLLTPWTFSARLGEPFPRDVGHSGLTMEMIIPQIWAESRGDHGAVSSTGCIGILQVNPSTAAEYGIRKWELYHPVLGLEAGIRIMRDLWQRWAGIRDPKLRWALTLASYNSGFYRTRRFYYGTGIFVACGARVKWYRAMPRQTLVYVQKIMEGDNAQRNENL